MRVTAIVITAMIVTLLYSTQALAGDWESIISCHSSGGGAVVDREITKANAYQLVIRDADTIKSFIEQGAFPEHEVNGRGEFIINLEAGIKNSFFTFTEFNGVFRKFKIIYNNGQLLVAAFALDDDGRTIQYKITDWSFNYCN